MVGRSGVAIASANTIGSPLAEFNIPELETQLATAQQRRTDLLLTGSDVEILKAEDETTKARLNLDRAHAAVEELNKRLVDARKAEARAAALKTRADAVAAVDNVITRIQSEYESHARAIVALAQEADAADVAATSVNNDIFRGASYEGLELVEKVHERLGWMEKFLSSHNFGGSISLPAIGAFPGVGDAARWHEK